MNTMTRLAMLMALAASCGGVETAMMDVDAGDGGASGATGSAGAGGAGGSSSGTGGACVPGAEGCACYGNGTCDAGLACLSHLCVMAGSAGAGAGGSTGGGRGGTTGLGNTTGTGNTTGQGGAAGTGNVTGTGNTTGQAGTMGTGNTTGTGNVIGSGGCTGTDMLCGGSCVNTNSNVNHCGGCNQPCNGTCSGGVCMATAACSSPQIACNGSCVDPRTSISNCGGCGATCQAGSICNLGKCWDSASGARTPTTWPSCPTNGATRTSSSCNTMTSDGAHLCGICVTGYVTTTLPCMGSLLCVVGCGSCP